MDVLASREDQKDYACDSTESQREIWIAAKMSKEANCAFNESISLRLEGQLNNKVLESALSELIRRHDALRSCLARDGKQLFVQKDMPLSLNKVDLSNHSARDAETRLQALYAEAVNQGFDLSSGPLVRFCLVNLGEAEQLLIITCHHIVCDAWSINLLARELGRLYSAHFDGPAVPPPSSFVDYANWERSEDAQRKIGASLNYWKDKLTPTAPFLELPLDKPRPPVKTYAAGHIVHSLGDRIVPRANELAAARDVSLPAVLITAFVAFAHRLTASQSILFGLPVSGQLSERNPRLVGHCLNVLPIKVEVSGDQTFADLLSDVEAELRRANEYPYISFGTLLKSLDFQRDPSRPALLSTMVNVDTNREQSWDHEGLSARWAPLPKSFETFDMNLNIAVSGNTAVYECTFNSDLWHSDTIDSRLNEMETLLDSSLVSPERAVKDLDIIPLSEQQLLEATCKGPFAEQPARHLSELLNLQRYAGRTAVTCAGESVDYVELDKRSNRLANHLLELGVERNDLIGVFVERSVDMLVSLLATWKAAAAYVALDPSYPADRLLYMAESARLKALITKSDLGSALDDYACQRVYLDGDARDIVRHSDQPPATSGDAADTSYVIFTSGSTGQPKGVQITHGGVINFLTTMAERPGLTIDDRLLAVTTLSFDIAVLELCLPLLVGARVVIAEREEALSGHELLALIDKHKINVMQATPTTWRWILAAGWKGGQNFKVLCGGEVFPLDLARRLTQCVGEVWNMYGPTETTVWSTCHRLEKASDLSDGAIPSGSIPAGPIPIGTPVANTQCYVLDENRKLVPAGVSGELYIGGAGVANGYLRQPERSAERFVENPLDGNDQLNRTRLYRTGDQARWRLDGLFECLGRLDSQIKLRGYRIELGEIEASLSKHPEVLECAASIVSYGESDQRLVAYARIDQGSSLNSTEMRRYLRGFLPDYMVPQLFMEVDALPLTPNGKVDRNNLPHPNPSFDVNEVARARTDTEQELVELWSELLRKTHESVDELFFDVGGHSLLAMDMIAKIEKRFGVQLHLLDILVNSIEQIAAEIDGARSDVPPPAEQAVAVNDEVSPSSDDYTALVAQRRPGFIGRLLGR